MHTHPPLLDPGVVKLVNTVVLHTTVLMDLQVQTLPPGSLVGERFGTSKPHKHRQAGSTPVSST